MRGRAAAVAARAAEWVAGRPWVPTLVALTTVAALVACVALADRTPGGDAPHLVGVELRLAELLRGGEPARAWRLFATLLAPQPPAGYLPGILTFFAFGPSWIAAPLAMAVPLLLAWDALRRLEGGRAPWIPWLAFVASPMVWLYVEQHGRDLVAAAVVLQALSWADAAVRRPGEPRAALFAGAWTAVAALTKYTAPAFLVLPLLAWVIGRWKHPRSIAWATLGGVIVAGPWYAAMGSRVVLYLRRSTGDMAAETLNVRDPWTLAELSSYPLALKDALGWPGVVALVVAVALGRRALPLLAALGGLAALSSLSVAQDRYALPAFACLVAAAAPLAARPWGVALALLAWLPQLAGTVATFRPGAPADVHARYAHDDARALAWPSPVLAYRPTRFDVDGWRVDAVVEALHAVHGAPEGTVGLLLPRLPDGPEFGTLLLRAARRGWSWDFASVNLAGGSEAYFVGPLRDRDWPSTDFRALFVVLTPRPDAAALTWLSGQRLTPTATFALPGGATGTVYERGP